MRWKIIFVNGGIVVVLALLTYFLLETSLQNVVANRAEQNRDLGRAVRAAESQLALDALRIERWLDQKTNAPSVRAVFQGGTAEARSDSATTEANSIRDAAVAEPAFTKMAPSLVLFVDDEGVGIGRNGSELMRGDKLAEAYPNLKVALKSGATASDVWINSQRQEQLFVSIAPVVSEANRVLGAVIVGTPLNDERLSRTSEITSGHSLAFLRVDGNVPTVVASTGPGAAGARDASVSQSALQAAKSDSPVLVGSPIGDRLFSAVRVSGYPGSNAVVVASVPASRVESIGGLLWPVFAIAGLGLVLVAAGGTLLGNYISRPVAEIEEGLLLIMNGHQNLRFELEHDELGGLASRINTLLNSLLGVQEDTTDAQGRPSTAPTGGDFTEALAVDESSVSRPTQEAGVAQALASAPEDEYYGQLFSEYIRAKKQLGDPVDHISISAFRSRIKRSEQDMLAKYGRPVRYLVELKEGSVVLVAVPLPSLVS
jgi:hypothetical protein